MIAWVKTPGGEGALVGFVAADKPDSPIRAIVLIDDHFFVFYLDAIEWLRWPE